MLNGPGYTDKSQAKRRKTLDGCVREYGFESSVNSVEVLLRSTQLPSDTRKKLLADKEYLMKKHAHTRSHNPSDGPCCSACAIGNPCEDICTIESHGHGTGRTPNPKEVRTLKTKLLR